MEMKALNRSQLTEVVEIYQQAEDYIWLERANPDAKAEARDFFDSLPPRKTYADKHNFGIYENKQLVGIADLIAAYPDSETYFIGLLLLIPSARQHGLGAQINGEIVKIAKMGQAKKIRLAVLQNNPQGLKFWQDQGYEILKQTKSLGSRKNAVYLLEANLLT